MGMDQIKRDIKVIMRLLPDDGTPMTVSELMLKMGEDVWPAINHLKDSGKVILVTGKQNYIYKVNPDA